MGFFGDVTRFVTGARTRDLERKLVALERRHADRGRGGLLVGEHDWLRRMGEDQLSDYLQLDHQLMRRYADYEEMSDHSDVALALDVVADEATIPNDDGRIVWVTSKDAELGTHLDDVLRKQIKFDDDAWAMARELALYGDAYAEVILYEGLGMIGLGWMAPPTVRRIEDRRGLLLGFLQDPDCKFQVGGFADVAKALQDPGGAREIGRIRLFEDWEILHWRIRGSGLRATTGQSHLEPARWAWKRLRLLEDSAMLHKLTRSSSRYVFGVEVGKMEEDRVWAYLEQFAQRFKRKKFVDSSGRLKLAPNVLSPDEDIFLPMRDGAQKVSVDQLGGSDYQDMTPVDYFQGKLFAALKVPKLRVGSVEEVRKDALIGQDVGFARMILRDQQEIRRGVRQALWTHLMSLGIDADKAEYDVRMQTASQIFELARMEVLSARADLMQRWSTMASVRWILVNIGKMSEEEAEQVWKGMVEDKLVLGEVDAQNAAKQQAAIYGAQSAVGGGAGEEEPRESVRRARGSVVDLWEVYGRGSRDQEKRLEDKLEGLVRSDRLTSRKLRRLEGLLHDLRDNLRSADRRIAA